MATSDAKLNKLFSKELKINIKGPSPTDNKLTQLLLELEWICDSKNLEEKVLAVHLNDKNDPFFYYMTNINEDDFCKLKEQQKLLVDFSSFPTMFIDLLDICLSQELKIQPKYLICLYKRRLETSTCAILSLEEKNPFKEIVHLSLTLPEVNGVLQRQYITASYRYLMDEKEKLESKLHSTEQELKKQLYDSQEESKAKLNKLETEIERLSGNFEKKELILQEEILKVKENLTKDNKIIIDKLEATLKENEEKYKISTNILEDKIKILEKRNKEQMDKEIFLEQNIKDLESRLSIAEKNTLKYQEEMVALEREKKHLDQAVQKVTNVNRGLDQKYSKILNQVTNLEQELRAALDEKNALERKYSKLQATFQKKETDEKKLLADFNKANDIIDKYRAQCNDLTSRLTRKEKECNKLREIAIREVKERETLELEMKSLKQQIEKQNLEVMKLKKLLANADTKAKEFDAKIQAKDIIINNLDSLLFRMLGPNYEMYSKTCVPKPIDAQNSKPNQTISDDCLAAQYLQQHKSITTQSAMTEQDEEEMPSYIKELFQNPSNSLPAFNATFPNVDLPIKPTDKNITTL